MWTFSTAYLYFLFCSKIQYTWEPAKLFSFKLRHILTVYRIVCQCILWKVMLSSGFIATYCFNWRFFFPGLCSLRTCFACLIDSKHCKEDRSSLGNTEGKRPLYFFCALHLHLCNISCSKQNALEILQAQAQPTASKMMQNDPTWIFVQHFPHQCLCTHNTG